MLPSLRLAGLALFASLVFGDAAMAAAATTPVEGVWRTKLASEVTIAPCPEGFCGYLSRVVVTQDMLQPGETIDDLEPKDYPDVRNKDPKLRTRPLLGLKILTLEVARKSPGHYEGHIYNPEDGNTYSGSVDMLDNDRLRLTGCALVILCRSEDWVRVQH